MKEPGYITSRPWSKQICEKLGIDWRTVSRIVIDLSPNQVALLYITFIGTEDLLDIEIPDPKDIKVIMGKRPDETQHEGD